MITLDINALPLFSSIYLFLGPTPMGWKYSKERGLSSQIVANLGREKNLTGPPFPLERETWMFPAATPEFVPG
jgi:hypothetical protein